MTSIDPNCPFCSPPNKKQSMEEWLTAWRNDKAYGLRTVPFKFDDQTKQTIKETEIKQEA